MKLKNLLNYLAIIALLYVSGTTMGQSSDEKSTLDEGTIEEQIDYVVDKSHMYEEYRVIKSVMFNKLKKHIVDTMNFVHNDLANRQETINAKSIQIDSLNRQWLSTQEKLNVAIRDKNSLKFFGMSMSKAGYNSLVWLIIAGLAAGLIIFILMFRRSHSVIRDLRVDMEQTRDEFEKHRKRALEREEQVVHKYHAELNKYKEKSSTHKSGTAK